MLCPTKKYILNHLFSISINPEDDGATANNMDSAALEVDAQADIFLDVPG